MLAQGDSHLGDSRQPLLAGSYPHGGPVVWHRLRRQSRLNLIFCARFPQHLHPKETVLCEPCVGIVGSISVCWRPRALRPAAGGTVMRPRRRGHQATAAFRPAILPPPPSKARPPPPAEVAAKPPPTPGPGGW